MHNRPFLNIGLTGLLVIAGGIFLMGVFPKQAPMPNGFKTPVIFFEFNNSANSLKEFFGMTETSSPDLKFVAAMDRGNRFDFAFAMVYSLFLFLFFRKISIQTGIKWFISGMILSVTTFIADVMENIQLLKITGALEEIHSDNQLLLLHVFTWIKWAGLAVSFVLISAWLRRYKGIFRIFAYYGFIPLILAIAAFIKPGILTEIFSKSVSMEFLILTAVCFLFKSDLKIQTDKIR